jgi:hypothetical protein
LSTLRRFRAQFPEILLSETTRNDDCPVSLVTFVTIHLAQL